MLVQTFLPVVEHLAGVAELRTMLGGVSRDRVHQLSRRPGFPKPVAVLGAGKIWNRAEVATWIEANRSTEDET